MYFKSSLLKLLGPGRRILFRFNIKCYSERNSWGDRDSSKIRACTDFQYWTSVRVNLECHKTSAEFFCVMQLQMKTQAVVDQRHLKSNTRWSICFSVNNIYRQHHLLCPLASWWPVQWPDQFNGVGYCWCLTLGIYSFIYKIHIPPLPQKALVLSVLN